MLHQRPLPLGRFLEKLGSAAIFYPAGFFYFICSLYPAFIHLSIHLS